MNQQVLSSLPAHLCRTYRGEDQPKWLPTIPRVSLMLGFGSFGKSRMRNLKYLPLADCNASTVTYADRPLCVNPSNGARSRSNHLEDVVPVDKLYLVGVPQKFAAM